MSRNPLADPVARERAIERPISAEHGTGYLALNQAVSLICGIPEGVSMHSDSQAWLLWTWAISPWRSWTVRTLSLEGLGRIVHIADFIECALERGFKVHPSAIARAREECEVSESFERRVRLSAIDRTLEELGSARCQTCGDILERDRRLAELETERRELLGALREAKELHHGAHAVDVLNSTAAGRGNEPNDDWRHDPSRLKSEKQDHAILACIAMKGWAPLDVPDGGKGTIEALCKKKFPELFDREHAFQERWKRGVSNDPPKWRMQNHASYSRRGKQPD